MYFCKKKFFFLKEVYFFVVVQGSSLPSSLFFSYVINLSVENIGNCFTGDEVLEWNGHSLQAKTKEEVHKPIINT